MCINPSITTKNLVGFHKPHDPEMQAAPSYLQLSLFLIRWRPFVSSRVPGMCCYCTYCMLMSDLFGGVRRRFRLGRPRAQKCRSGCSAHAALGRVGRALEIGDGLRGSLSVAYLFQQMDEDEQQVAAAAAAPAPRWPAGRRRGRREDGRGSGEHLAD